MRIPHQRGRRGTSLGVAVVTLAVAVVLPALERGSGAREPVMESGRSPASCPSGHEHSICTQVEASTALAGAPHRQEARETVAMLRAVGLATFPAPRALPRGHPSRAPPAV